MEKSASISLAGVLTIIGSIIMVFLGIILLFMYKGTVEYYNVAVFYPALYMGVLYLSAFVLSLLGGLFLLKRKHFTLSILGVVVMLVSGLAPAFAFQLDGYVWTNGLLLGSPLTVLSSIALILVFVGKSKK